MNRAAAPAESVAAGVGAAGGGGRGFFHQDGPAGEGEVAGVVVDHVHLAGVEAGLQGLQRQIDLEDDGFAVGRGYFAGHDLFRFVDFRVSLQKFDAGENADGVARRFVLRRIRGTVAGYIADAAGAPFLACAAS